MSEVFGTKKLQPFARVAWKIVSPDHARNFLEIE